MNTTDFTIKPGCIVQLDDLISYVSNVRSAKWLFVSHPYPITLKFELSPFLMENLVNAKMVALWNIGCSWTQISVLMQHFRILNGSCPRVQNNSDVFDDLQNDRSPLLSIDSGLLLLDWTPVEDETDIMKYASGPKYTPDDTLQPLPGMETVTCLVIVLHPYNYPIELTLPSVFQDNLWPELLYLQLHGIHFNVSNILKLRETAPRLNYLKVSLTSGIIPDVVWTFDWDSLPWRTGFVYLPPINQIDLKGKLGINKIPPFKFLYDIESRLENCPKKNYIQVDLSNNALTSLEYFVFAFDTNTYTDINLSHNNLTSPCYVWNYPA